MDAAQPQLKRAVAAVMIAVLLGACEGDPSQTPKVAPSACETPREDPAAIVPEGFPIGRFATVVRLQERRRFLGIEAITDMSIVELYPVLARSLLDEGYQILSGDNEGFEAEIFFARGTKATGTYILVEGPCRDLVTIRLLINETSGTGNR